MDIGPEEFWAQMEGLRTRVRALCSREDREERASIDSEFVELRERTWSTLNALTGKQR